MHATDRLTVAAPAKVNLFLHVTGRRPDGYHLIESLFALIDFADFVSLECRLDGAILRARDLPGVDAAEDLSLRAATLLKSATGTDKGVAITVDKRIPQGGGLGGGSSDAASVLVALNRLWGCGLPRDELAGLGAKLGADVPFFIQGENALVRGIGDVVEPVSLTRQWLALAMPPVSVSTASIFSARELTRSTASAKIIVFSGSYGHNDLQPVASIRHPAVASALDALGSRATGARLSGSGACVFAVCDSAEAARVALQALPDGIAGRVVRTIARHPLAEW